MRAPIRCLITGSRNWPDREFIDDALDTVVMTSFHQGFPGIVVVHGACPRGADAFADGWARNRRRRGWPVEPERHPADWGRYGSRAGFIRNQAMVDLGADLCLAFLAPCVKPQCRRSQPHPSHGAGQCADLAEAAGVRTVRFPLPTPSTSPGRPAAATNSSLEG